MTFDLVAPFKPAGDQPQAIASLVDGLKEKKAAQVLLGITGSGKTFTMANVVATVQRPTLVLAHNKTLAGQLYQEFRSFFPNNAVEYFVSYYDYYQPEAYIPRTDTYIEKDMAINDEIDRMRLSATRALLERRDVLIVASVSCIYGLGLPEHYIEMRCSLQRGQLLDRDAFLMQLVHMRYERNDWELERGRFRVRGDVIEILPAYEEAAALRIELWNGSIERIRQVDVLTGKQLYEVQEITLYPASHFVTPVETRERAIASIQAELQPRLAEFEATERFLEKQRLLERTRYDVEMIRETGTCKGIENYSRHFSQRLPGEPPACLLDYFPDDFLFIIDESHQTLPQLHAMYAGDRARKSSLIEYGFRLPSALDNRPLNFDEVYGKFFKSVIYVSATPAEWEIGEAKGAIVEQIIRPTGLLDPMIEVRPATGQIDDVLSEIDQITKKGARVLVTTLTKKLSEELTKYLTELGIKAKYLHSDIDTIERSEIIRDLRLGAFEVLVGINLLREGLDMPEVALVCILDADKQGFLRSETALIQTCGRAARNEQGKVILYADRETKAIARTVEITKNRRAIQEAFNKEHGIIPRTIIREIQSLKPQEAAVQEKVLQEHLSLKQIEKKALQCERAMRKAAKEWRFEEAARLRDEWNALKLLLLG